MLQVNALCLAGTFSVATCMNRDKVKNENNSLPACILEKVLLINYKPMLPGLILVAANNYVHIWHTVIDLSTLKYSRTSEANEAPLSIHLHDSFCFEFVNLL